MLKALYGETFPTWFDRQYPQLQQIIPAADFERTHNISKDGWLAALEARKFSAEYKLLDHGYLRYVEHWGRGDADVDEAGIIEAARQSTQGSFRGWEKDQKLLETLFCSKPQHGTPFEFAGLVIEAQLPFWVIREWHRHRTQSYNELSARYEPVPDVCYIPSYDRCVQISNTNKQAGTIKGAPELTRAAYLDGVERMHANYVKDEEDYQFMLNAGFPKELARNVIPMGRYTRMRAQANLRNWFAFVTLRSDEKAAWEIQEYSRAVEVILEQLFPRTYGLFQKLRAT